MPRRAARVAAALLLLALGAGGCKPSSLTPFGIDTRSQNDLDSNINGFWEGSTASGGTIEFLVASSKVTTLTMTHREAGCVKIFEGGSNAVPVSGGAFRIELFFDPAGRLVLDGAFPAADTATGSYFFEALSYTPPCPTASSGTFTAGKVH